MDRLYHLDLINLINLINFIIDGRTVDLHPVDRLYHLQRKELSGNGESNRRKERFSEKGYLNSWDVSLIGTRVKRDPNYQEMYYIRYL